MGSLLALAALVASTPAAAQEPSPADRAYSLFQESVEKYRQGRFEQAASLLEEAYELDPDPVLLYNLARAYEGMGRFADAVSAYERYLAQAPDTPDRGAIEARLATLRRETRDRERREHDAASGEEEEGGGIGAAPFFVLGVGAAAMGVGALCGVLSDQAHDDAVEAPDFTGAYTSQQDAESYATAANVAFAVGGAALIGGAIWLLLVVTEDSDREPGPTAGAAVAPGSASFWVSQAW